MKTLIELARPHIKPRKIRIKRANTVEPYIYTGHILYDLWALGPAANKQLFNYICDIQEANMKAAGLL